MMKTILLLALLGQGNGGLIQPPPRNSAASGVVLTGACSSEPTGLVCCVDDSGMRCGWPPTDVAAPDAYLQTYSGAPLGSTSGNRTGGDVRLCSLGTRRAAMTASGCDDATDTITITIDGAPTVGTDGTEFDCDGAASDQACAASVATWLDGLTGVGACAGTACTALAGVDGTWYLWPDGACTVTLASNDDPACAAITSGENGTVQLGGNPTTTNTLTVYVGDQADGSGFGKSGTNMALFAGAALQWVLAPGEFRGSASANTLSLRNVTMSATVPGFAVRSDTDSGLGWCAADSPGIVAGGVSAFCATEASGEVQLDFAGGDCTFANLGTPSDGRFCFCSDCTVGAPCTGSGSGAFALRRAGAWGCY